MTNNMIILTSIFIESVIAAYSEDNRKKKVQIISGNRIFIVGIKSNNFIKVSTDFFFKKTNVKNEINIAVEIIIERITLSFVVQKQNTTIFTKLKIDEEIPKQIKHMYSVRLELFLISNIGKMKYKARCITSIENAL